jgi:hypothetical protein
MVAVRQREKPPRFVAEPGVWVSAGQPDSPTCIPPVAARKLSWMRECYIPGPPEQSQRIYGEFQMAEGVIRLNK